MNVELIYSLDNPWSDFEVAERWIPEEPPTEQIHAEELSPIYDCRDMD